MGLLDRFVGPPSEDKFATLVADTLRKVGDVRLAKYDKSLFRLLLTEDGEDAGVVSLRNLFKEFCALPKSERDDWLKRTCIGLLSHLKEVPEDFEDVKPDLRPSIRPRSFVEYMQLTAEVEGTKHIDVPTIPISDHLLACVVYDMPGSMMFVTQDFLDTWGVTIYEAMEVARHNLDEIEFSAMLLGDKLYVLDNGDSYDASRLLMLDKIRRMNFVGQPVAMAVNRSCLMLTGSKDVEGLRMMADLAEKKAEEPRRLCSYPITLVGDEWVAWLPPEDHPHYPTFRRLSLNFIGTEYHDQKDQLEKLHAKKGIDVFVASFSSASKDGKEFSFCTWSKDVQSWLPQTDLVGLYDPDEEFMGLVPWEMVQSTVGHLMKPLDCYPPRWLVDEFPTKEQLMQMRADKL